MNNKKPVSPKLRAAIISCAIIAVLIIVGILVYILLFHQAAPAPTTANQNTKGESAQNSNNNTSTKISNGTGNTSQPGDNKSSNGGSTTTTKPDQPTGDFVSNHKPGQNGSPLTESSVCNTSPGASCQISFSMDSTTISLPKQTTDRGGATYWNDWTPAQLGLTPGDWQVRAIATMNGQTSTTVDATKLTVSP